MDEKQCKEPKISRKDFLWELLYYISIFTIMIGILFGQQTSSAPRVINGYSVLHVLTSSMEPEIPKETLIVTKMVDGTTLQIGDDITYMIDATTSVTHRIVGILEDYQGTGEFAFETKGIANKKKDLAPVPSNNIIGKVIYHNYNLGKAVAYISSHWYIILSYLILYILLKNGINILFVKSDKKREKVKKLKLERSEKQQTIYQKEIDSIYEELQEHYDSETTNCSKEKDRSEGITNEPK